MSAEDLGKRLLAEVEEVTLDEILTTLHLHETEKPSCFNLPSLDALLQAFNEARIPSGRTPTTSSPIVELMSFHAGSATTRLIYHLTALAVLPTWLGGRQACVLIIDAEQRFSAQHLAQQIKAVASLHCNADSIQKDANEAISLALKHIHIFRPQSMASTISTTNSFQTYLFDATKHHSFDRAIAFIALDSASSFYWQTRSDAEDAALPASMPGSSKTSHPPPPASYNQLATALKNASQTLHAPIIFATRIAQAKRNTTGFEISPRSFRSPLPPPWQTFPTLRLVVQRVAARKLPIGTTLEKARREEEQRRKGNAYERFECFVNEWGVEEKTLSRLHECNAVGFEFRLMKGGLVIDSREQGGTVPE